MSKEKIQDKPANSQDTKLKIAYHIKEILLALGVEINDSTTKTPERVAKFYYDELFKSLNFKEKPRIAAYENSHNYSEPLIQKNIDLITTCEHHLVPIVGRVLIAYKPKNRIIGLSKLNRIVEYFSKMPQIQERLTMQIFNYLKEILKTNDIAVIIEAQHYCIKIRGIKNKSSLTKTSAYDGDFNCSNARIELNEYNRN